MADQHEHDLGLAHDLATMERLAWGLVPDDGARRFHRRDALRLIGGASLAALVGCGADRSRTAAAPTTSASAVSPSAAAGSASSAAGAAACKPIPAETAGPFPGDGSNGPDALGSDGVVRSDITRSFGPFGSNAAAGVPLTVVLRITKASDGCAPLQGGAVHVWHCDRDGRYSMYELERENYLRGVQVADAEGSVTFRSIYPGAYPGRYPHIHFEVFESLAAATSARRRLRISQLALPAEANGQAYAAAGYERSLKENARTTLAGDGVFRDDRGVAQTPTFSGDARSGFTMEMDVPV